MLLRGAPGSGKTALALDLIEAARARGLFARLLCDDRVGLAARHGRLLAFATPEIAGLVERRGLGLAPLAHEPSALVRLVVDRGQDAPARLPEPADLIAEIAGVSVPRLALGPGAGQAAHVLAALGLFGDEPWASA